MITPIRVFAVAIVIARGSFSTAEEVVPAPMPVQRFVTVEENVKLEVVDWGGSGRPLVLLPGLGDKAHVFDKFAVKLTPKYHVYGITRRGFGASSIPTSGYSSERLGEDVITVLNELKIERPILAGHSIAGSELSYVGSVYPERIAALVYLDAAYAYAFYAEDAHQSFNMLIDSIELRKTLEQLPTANDRNLKQLLQELLTSVQRFEKEVREQQEFIKDMPAPPKNFTENTQPAGPTPAQLIFGGLRKYTDIRVPSLAIFAMPRSSKEFGSLPSAAVAKILASNAVQADAVEKGVPSAHVVRIAEASHYVFRSNESDVLREIDEFVGKLPPADTPKPNQ
jgi:pimeloyl-ACP methyl ester carboxylesterase